MLKRAGFFMKLLLTERRCVVCTVVEVRVCSSPSIAASRRSASRRFHARHTRDRQPTLGTLCKGCPAWTVTIGYPEGTPPATGTGGAFLYLAPSFRSSPLRKGKILRVRRAADQPVLPRCQSMNCANYRQTKLCGNTPTKRKPLLFQLLFG